MDRSHATRTMRPLSLILTAALLSATAGCAQMIATVAYVWNGGNYVDADYRGLEHRRVVVICVPPSSLSFRYPHADRQLARRVGSLLEMNVKGIDLVDAKEVDNWVDEDDERDVRELAKAVDADMVVRIQLEDFDLHKGQTLFQGRADVILSVYDMSDGGRLAWEKELPEVLYPANSGVPTVDKSQDQFRRQFTRVLSEQIARHFYRHDPHFDFAIDATSIR